MRLKSLYPHLVSPWQFQNPALWFCRHEAAHMEKENWLVFHIESQWTLRHNPRRHINSSFVMCEPSLLQEVQGPHLSRKRRKIPSKGIPAKASKPVLPKQVTSNSSIWTSAFWCYSLDLHPTPWVRLCCCWNRGCFVCCQYCGLHCCFQRLAGM